MIFCPNGIATVYLGIAIFISVGKRLQGADDSFPLLMSSLSCPLGGIMSARNVLFFLFSVACATPIPLVDEDEKDSTGDDGESDFDPPDGSDGTDETDDTDPNSDADGDGFTDIDGDCDDNNAAVYPGSAAEATAEQCMMDGDGDGFGDMNALEPYDPGTDCDDTDANTHPGAAELETNSTDCMTDADGDGYGSSTPASGVSAGSDGWDDDPSRWFQPGEGHWTYGEATILSNTCSNDSGSSENTDQVGFTLTNLSDVQFKMVPDGTTEEVICNVNGMSYDCPTSTAYETIEEQGIDIELAVYSTIGGVFADGQNATATFQLEFHCNDVDSIFFGCSDTSDYLPCTVSFSLPVSMD